MGWSVCLVDSDGETRGGMVELLELGEVAAPGCIDDVGIDQMTAKDVLAKLQAAFVALQEAALAVAARERADGSPEVSLKDYRVRKINTLFGTVSLRVPRLTIGGSVLTCLPAEKGARSTRELTTVRDRLSAWMSYRRAMAFLSDLYPVDGGVAVATAQRGIGRAAGNIVPFDATPHGEGNSTISLPLDTTFIRGSDTDRYHGLEILVGAVGQGSELIQYFAAPLSLKTACVALGKAAIGGASVDRVEAFSDSDRSVRAMAQAIGIKEKPISDWFHLSMRVQHVLQVADALDAPTASIARANEAVQGRIREMKTALWKGDTKAVARTQRGIQPHLKKHADEPNPVKRQGQVKRLRAGMKKLAKYVKNPEARIVDYCERKIDGKPLGTTLVEGAADFVVNARMARKQHMRWSTKGAHDLLQVRTADINRLLRDRQLAA